MKPIDTGQFKAAILALHDRRREGTVQLIRKKISTREGKEQLAVLAEFFSGEALEAKTPEEINMAGFAIYGYEVAVLESLGMELVETEEIL